MRITAFGLVLMAIGATTAILPFSMNGPPSVEVASSGNLYEEQLALVEDDPFEIIVTLSAAPPISIRASKSSSFVIELRLAIESIQTQKEVTLQPQHVVSSAGRTADGETLLNIYINEWIGSGRLLYDLELAGLAETVPAVPLQPEVTEEGSIRVSWSVLPVEGIDSLSGRIRAIDATDPFKAFQEGEEALSRFEDLLSEERPFRVGFKAAEYYIVNIAVVTPLFTLLQTIFVSLFGSAMTLTGAATLYTQWRKHSREEEKLSEQKNNARSKLILPK